MPIPGFLANIEDEHPDVGAGSHKVQRGWVVLVPLQGLFGLQLLLNNNRAGILKQSMGARNRVGIVLSYRPARLHRLAEFIPWNRFLDSINV
jgi:hypothetical protein